MSEQFYSVAMCIECCAPSRMVKLKAFHEEAQSTTISKSLKDFYSGNASLHRVVF